LGTAWRAKGVSFAQLLGVGVDRIRVAVVITAYHPGGTERQMIELIRRLDRGRFDVRVACFHRQGAWLPRVEEAVPEILELPLRSFASLSTIGVAHQFAGWLRERRIDVVQACDRYANIFALPAAALAGTAVRVGGRRELSPPGQTRAHLMLMRLAYRSAHRIVANSRGAVDSLRNEGVATEKIALIPNGIDVGLFAPRHASREDLVVATVANLRPGKGHDVLLRAAAVILRQRPSLRFRLIGGGPLANDLAELARTLGIAHAVDFLGHRDDVPAQLADSDIYAFPSLTEAFPNGLIEGMAAGLPVVASDAPGINELIRPGDTGLLVPPGDHVSLAEAILQLVDDPARASRLASAARAAVHSRYSFERMVTAFEALYVGSLSRTRYAVSGTPTCAESLENSGSIRQGPSTATSSNG
jgi:glycosyltransferase involved in cell wall biosynthesis